MILKYPAAAWAETASAYVTKNRVAARRRIIVFAAICSIPLWFMLSGREGRTAPAGHNQAGPESRTPTFRVA